MRGGGHNVAGQAVQDDAVMIDLSLMKDIEVDPDAKTVAREGGVLWGELNDATAASTASPRPAARSRRPASRASRSAAGSAG